MLINSKRTNLILWVALCLLLSSATVMATDWPRFHADNANSGVTADSGPESDNVVWRFVNRDRGQFKAPPAVVEGNVYAADDDGYIYCFDAADGSIIWEGQLYGSFKQSGPCVDSVNRKVYIANTSGVLYCLNMDGSSNSTAEVLWSYDSEKSYPSTPVLDGSNVIFAADNWLFSLDQFGSLLWRFFSDAVLGFWN